MEVQESISSTKAFDLSRQVSGELTETIPTRLSAVVPRPLADPMRFVATGRAPLVRSTSEQLERVQRTRTASVSAKIVEEDCTDWQNNLDNWKSSRRKRQETVIERLTEVKRMEEAENGSRRRGKTFDEMVQDRNEKSGGRVSNGLLRVYTEDSGDIGTLLTSKSPTSGSDTTRSDLGFNTGSDSGSEHSSDHQEVDDKRSPRSSSGKNVLTSRQIAPSDSTSPLVQRLADNTSVNTASAPPVLHSSSAVLRSGAGLSTCSQEDSGTEECTYDSAIREYIRFAEKTCSPVRSIQGPTVTDPSGSCEGTRGHVLQRRSVFERSERMASTLPAQDGEKRSERKPPVTATLSGGLRERIARLETTSNDRATVVPSGDDDQTATRGRQFRQKLAMFSSISENDRRSCVKPVATRQSSNQPPKEPQHHEEEDGDGGQDGGNVDISSQLSAANLRLRFEQLAAAAEIELASSSSSSSKPQQRCSQPAATTAIRSENTVRRSNPATILSATSTTTTTALLDSRGGDGGGMRGRGAPCGLELKQSVVSMLSARPSHWQHVVSVSGKSEGAGVSSSTDRDRPSSLPDAADSLVGQMEAQILNQLELNEKNKIVEEEDPAMVLDFTSSSSEAEKPPSEKPPPPPMNGLSSSASGAATPECSSSTQMTLGSLRSPAEIRDDLRQRKQDFFSSGQSASSTAQQQTVCASSSVPPLSNQPSSEAERRAMTESSIGLTTRRENAEVTTTTTADPASTSVGRFLSVDDELDRQEREIIEGLEREENWRLQQQAKYKSRLSRMPSTGCSSAEDDWWSQSQPSLNSMATPTLSTLSRAAQAETESSRESSRQLLASAAHSRSNPSLQRTSIEPSTVSSAQPVFSQQRRSLLAPAGWSQPNSLHHKTITPPQLNIHRQHQQPKLRHDVPKDPRSHWVVQEAEQRRVSDVHIRQASKISSSSDNSDLHRTNLTNGSHFPENTTFPTNNRQLVHHETNGVGSASVYCQPEPKNGPSHQPIHSTKSLPYVPYTNRQQHQQNYIDVSNCKGSTVNNRVPKGIDPSSSSSMFGRPMGRPEVVQPIYENTPAQLGACMPNWGTSSNSGSSVSNDYVGGAAMIVPPGGQDTHEDRVLSVSGRTRCSHCSVELGRGAAMVIESLHLFYHIGCFKCCVCSVQLGNGSMGADVRVRNNKLHCHNCYSNDDGLKFSKV